MRTIQEDLRRAEGLLQRAQRAAAGAEDASLLLASTHQLLHAIVQRLAAAGPAPGEPPAHPPAIAPPGDARPPVPAAPTDAMTGSGA